MRARRLPPPLASKRDAPPPHKPRNKRIAPIPDDTEYLAAAARLAARARPLSRPNPAVGALIVNSGRIVGRGWTQPGGRPHAEAVALAQAGTATAGATAYVTLEPCAHLSQRGPACADMLAGSGIIRVVVGVTDPDARTSGAGIERLRAAGITVDVLKSEAAQASLAGYLLRQREARPLVTLKLAMSLDGCMAMADGSSQWITGEAARAHVHAQRAWHDAILVGGGTWRTDKPRLDVRLPGLAERSPQRIVLTRGEVPDGVTGIAAPEQIGLLTEMQYLYVEGGPATASAFLAADLVDRLHIYRAPILIGNGLHALEDIGLAALDDAHGRWQLTERRQLGSDSFAAYSRLRN